MNTYLFYRRIRGPIYLLTFGLTALLWEWHILSWEQSWPLYLIVAGVLRLAEGAALANAGPPPLYPGPAYPGPAYNGIPQQQPTTWSAASATPGTATPSGYEAAPPSTPVYPVKPEEGS